MEILSIQRRPVKTLKDPLQADAIERDLAWARRNGATSLHEPAVADHRAERTAAGRLDLRRHCVRGAEVEVGDRDLPAFARTGQRDLAADAARRAGDDGALALQS